MVQAQTNIKNRRPSGQKKAGFTIVELLIVIVVIGILAAISVFAYNGINDRAKDAANESNVTNILKMAEVHRSFEGVYPSVISIWLGYDDYGNSQVTYRLNTNVADADSSIYQNPAAPDWAGSAMILNINPNVSGHVRPFDGWTRTVTVEVPVPVTIPGGYSSWDAFYSALEQSTAAWMAQHPMPPEDAPPEELEQYTLDFLAAYPQFGCLMTYEGCGDDGEEQTILESREVKKEWMYFLDLLVKPEDAAQVLCINSSRDYARVTGFRMRYYSQTQDEWLTKDTGSGVLGNFITCAM